MLKKLIFAAAALIALFVLITMSGACYTVSMYQQVIITQFQAPVGKPIAEPGLHWKTPFIQKANYFDKRWLEWESEPTQVPTLDKKLIWVQLYARWRISDPLLFFQRLSNETMAQTRIDDIVDGETRIAISQHRLIEIVRSTNRPFTPPEGAKESGHSIDEADYSISIGREKILEEILAKVKPLAKENGIEIVDVRIKRINYIPSVRQKIYERMISERQKIAQNYRSEGRGESERILGEMEKELRKIRSESYRQAQEIVGQADADAAKIYAEAYNVDPEFYSFYKTMLTYRQALDSDTWLILSTEGEFYKYMGETR